MGETLDGVAADPRRLEVRPEGRAVSVERLMESIARGRVRVPEFQRGLRWRSAQVIELFDSVFRGFPIGQILFSRRPAPPSVLHFGPLQVDAPQTSDALFVVDGQQRLTALAGALLHPEARPRADIHAVWFDLLDESFHRLERQAAPPTWIPLNVVLDSIRLLGWLDAWAYRKDRPDLARRAIALGKAIREYEVLTYTVEGASEQVLRVIFSRTNRSGVKMSEAEVFQALARVDSPDILRASCARLAVETGFGDLTDDLFLRCLKVVSGAKLKSSLTDEQATRAYDASTVATTEAALRRAIVFLIEDAEIPHRALLPYSLVLPIAARFFALHADPEPRVRILLSRWVWRGAESGEHARSSDADLTMLRDLIDDDVHASVQRLLATVPAYRDRESPAEDPWNGRSASVRIAALGMLALKPRDPVTGLVIPLDALRARLATHALASVFVDIDSRAPRGVSVVARRVVMPDRAKVARLVDADAETLRSHAIDDEALVALKRGDFFAFATARAELLGQWLDRFIARRLGEGEGDRVSIQEIVRRVALKVGAA